MTVIKNCFFIGHILVYFYSPLLALSALANNSPVVSVIPSPQTSTGQVLGPLETQPQARPESKNSYGILSLYSMQDLEILFAEKNYQEFFHHALDIRPSQRDQHWKDMVSAMAENFVQEQIKKNQVSDFILQQVEKLLDWPILQQNEFFMKGRDQLGLLYFQKCFQDELFQKEKRTKAACFQEMVRFWKLNSNDPYLGLEFAKLARNNLPTPLDLGLFVQKSFKHPFSTFLCREPIVKEQIFSFFTQGLLQETSPSKVRQMIDESLSIDCWNVFKEELEQALQGHSGQIPSLAYLLLKSKAELKSQLRDFYLTQFILQGPIQGETFNEAWNLLRELGQSHSRRMKLLESLKKLDPLPGKVFKLHNQQKKSIILDYLSRNFPEYMDFYARTCLNYLSGKGDFPNGNPTLYCRDLIRSVENTSWVDLHLQKSISTFKKF